MPGLNTESVTHTLDAALAAMHASRRAMALAAADLYSTPAPAPTPAPGQGGTGQTGSAR
jgi:hypothetical protein